MIGGIYTEFTRDAWTTIPGRDVKMVNNADGNPVKITYLSDGKIAFVKYLTYDTNKAIIQISCKEE